MADLKFIAETTEQALAAATAKSLIRIVSPSNVRVKILGWGVYFDGVSAIEPPVEVRLISGESASAGTFTATLGAVDANGSKSITNGVGGTVASVASALCTSEPTVVSVLDAVEVHPQAGFTYHCSKGDEIVINGDTFIAIECTAPAIVNARAKIFCEE